MITTDVASILRSQIADGVEIDSESESRIEFSTPFFYSDGDHCGFFLLRDDAGEWRITDGGDVITRAGYAGVDLLSAGRRDRFLQAVGFYGLSERDGELSRAIKDNSFGDAFYRFAQACLDISRLAKLPAETAKTVNKESVKAKLAIIASTAFPDSSTKRNWHDDEADPHKIYKVDVHISLPGSRQLLLFGVDRFHECLNAAVSCLHYSAAGKSFEAAALIEGAALQDKGQIVMSDAKIKLFPNDRKDDLVDFLRSKAA